MEDKLERINVKTSQNREVVDITDQISKLLSGQKIETGFCHLFVRGTNVALTTTLLDPKADLSVASVFEITTPELATPQADERYHRHVTPVSTPVVASFLGPSLALPFENKQLVLGESQKVVLVELAGPKEYQVVVDFSN